MQTLLLRSRNQHQQMGQSAVVQNDAALQPGEDAESRELTPQLGDLVLGPDGVVLGDVDRVVERVDELPHDLLRRADRAWAVATRVKMQFDFHLGLFQSAVFPVAGDIDAFPLERV